LALSPAVFYSLSFEQIKHYLKLIKNNKNNWERRFRDGVIFLIDLYLNKENFFPDHDLGTEKNDISILSVKEEICVW
jgi:hypothetical protein